MRRTPLRRQSAKRQAAQKARVTLVADQLEARPYCEAVAKIVTLDVDQRWRCKVRSHDLHEPLTRARGGSILDPANTIAVCRACHDWIHAHPRASLGLGLLRQGP